MKRMILPLSAVILLFLLAACSDSTNPPAEPAVISGVLADAAGAPVADAAVVMDLDLKGVTLNTFDKPKTLIQFRLPEASPYELTITDACDDELFFSVNSEQVAAGTYSITWDGTDLDGLTVPEGMYHYHQTIPDREPQMGVAVLAHNLTSDGGDFAAATCDTVRQTWRIAAWTDADGKFTIDRSCWDFGRQFDATDENGDPAGRMEITSQVRLWFYPEGRSHGFASDWATYDAGSGATFTVTMQPEPEPAR